MNYSNGSWSLIPNPVASESPGSKSEMQILRPYSTPSESDTGGSGGH